MFITVCLFLSLAASQAWPTAYLWELGVCIPSASLSPSMPSTLSCQDKSGQTPRKRVTSCPPFTMCRLHWPPAHVSVHDTTDWSGLPEYHTPILLVQWISLEFYTLEKEGSFWMSGFGYVLREGMIFLRQPATVFWINFKMPSDSHQQEQDIFCKLCHRRKWN